ncbi:hypothetical protein BSL78_27344, partial [Apostichopus japonicus]
NLLPPQYHHFICKHVDGKSAIQGETTIRLSLRKEEYVSQWLKDFQDSSYMTWRKSKPYPDSGRYNSYKSILRCRHNTRQSQTKCITKNTNCPATMTLRLKRMEHSRNRKSRSKDPHMQNENGLPFIVSLRNQHNHPIFCADAMRRRPVSNETIKALEELYGKGHSPSSALDSIKSDLQENHGDDYVLVSGDRSICPDVQFCYRLYYKMFQKAYGAATGVQMLVDMEERLSLFNSNFKETCAVMEMIQNQVIIAICSPLMKRVHTKLKHSAEMVFINSSGNCDRHNSRIFILLTHSIAGGLPLGVFITSSETQQTIEAGLRLLRSIFPDGPYFNRNESGPKVVITDDCQTLRQSITAVYPNTRTILCVFYVLQAMWR